MERSPSAAGQGISAPARGVFQVLAATVFYAGVAPVAKLVALDAAAITFFRAVFGAASLALFLAFRPGAFRIPRAEVPSLLWMGALMAGNWYFFVLAAQVSTVAIAVVCLFTYPLLTTLIEPWFFDEPRRWPEIAGGALVVAGCALLVPRLSFDDAATRGALFGVVSALCLSFRNVLNRRAVRHTSSSTLTFYQFVVAGVLFVPAALAPAGWPAAADIPLLVLIGSVMTALSHVLFTASLRHLSASRASLLLSLQPIFAAALAAALLAEVPSLSTVAGGLVILLGALLPALFRDLARP